MIDRFNEKYTPDPFSNCWIWTGAIDQCGYGRFNVEDKNRHAHRVSFELNVGPIPEGMHVLHSCHTRCCVNPKHLKLGTHQDNMLDMKLAGRARNNNQKTWLTRLNGRTSLKRLSEEAGIKYTTVHMRLKRGWSIERSLGHAI